MRDGAPVVLRSEIPIRYVFNDDGSFTNSVSLQHRWFPGGGWFGFRLKNSGEDGRASQAKPFFVHTPTRIATDGRLELERPDGADGAVEIRGGFVTDLDDDPAAEVVICGTDASGGWFAVVHLTDDGRLPAPRQQTTRSWSGGSYQAPRDQQFACILGDVDLDGTDDLVVLAGNSPRYPSVVIHRGTGDAQLFRAQGERIVWEHGTFHNRYVKTLEVEGRPAISLRVSTTAGLRTVSAPIGGVYSSTQPTKALRLMTRWRPAMRSSGDQHRFGLAMTFSSTTPVAGRMACINSTVTTTILSVRLPLAQTDSAWCRGVTGPRSCGI